MTRCRAFLLFIFIMSVNSVFAVSGNDLRSYECTPGEQTNPIDFDQLIPFLGGENVDLSLFPATMQGFQDFLSESGVQFFRAEELGIPHRPQIARDCGYEDLLPPKSCWKRGLSLALIADQLRGIVNEPIFVRNWWRPACYNSHVGGGRSSDHLWAQALDLDFMSRQSKEAAKEYLCTSFWMGNFSQFGRRNFSMSIGLGAKTIHLGLFPKRGRRFWFYRSYHVEEEEEVCWASPRDTYVSED